MLRLRNVHPGEVLRTEFLAPIRMHPDELAKALDVPARTVTELLACRRPVCVDLAIRLARVFDVRERFWLGLQMDYDLEEALLVEKRSIGISTDLG